jgi:hypothetical protein
VTLEDCQQWCTALLWIVPARVEGTWRVGDGELLLEQAFQVVTGALDGQPVADGRLRGDEISFTAGDSSYTGRVNGNTIEGTVTTRGTESRWRARRN